VLPGFEVADFSHAWRLHKQQMASEPCAQEESRLQTIISPKGRLTDAMRRHPDHAGRRLLNGQRGWLHQVHPPNLRTNSTRRTFWPHCGTIALALENRRRDPKALQTSRRSFFDRTVGVSYCKIPANLHASPQQMPQTAESAKTGHCGPRIPVIPPSGRVADA